MLNQVKVFRWPKVQNVPNASIFFLIEFYGGVEKTWNCVVFFLFKHSQLNIKQTLSCDYEICKYLRDVVTASITKIPK